MIPPRRFHGRFGTPLRAGFAAVLALLLTPPYARAQYQVTNDCFACLFGSRLIRVIAGTDPTFPSYDMGASGWAVPGDLGSVQVSLDNRAAVGSMRFTLLPSTGLYVVYSPVSVETTERTRGFQTEWSFDGSQLQVHLFSTSGGVIEPGIGPIARVVSLVRSDFEWVVWNVDTPDVIRGFGFGFPDGYGGTSVVLDPLGLAIPWCGPGFNPSLPTGGGVLVLHPEAVFDTPASVTSIGPHVQTNVDVHTNVTAVFSEDVLPASVNGSTFTLTGGSRPVTGMVTLSGRTATLNPDLPLEFGTHYAARVQGVQDLEGNPVSYGYTASGFWTVSTPTGLGEPTPEAPSVTAARPNPFGVETTLSYSLPTAARTSARVYSASGRLIRTLVDSDMPAGVHRASWDGRDSEGTAVSSGVYFLRFAGAGMSKTQRLMLLR